LRVTRFRTGIDLGGSKIEAIVLNENGQEVFRHRIPTPQNSYSNTVASIEYLIKKADETVDTETKVGIGIPGSLSPTTKLVRNANSTWLIGKPLKQDLEEILGRTVLVENDANCFAVSEAYDGSASKAHTVFGVILGTGVGAGFVIGNKIHQGKNQIAGEWGHNPIPWVKEGELPGERCYCGKNGCLETFISGPAVERQYKNRLGKELEMPNIVVESENGNPVAEEIIKVFENRLARALAQIINVLDPDAIVLGGGLSNIDRLYKNIPKIWGKYIFSDSVSTALHKAKYGDSSGVRGAAWLWEIA
tara:strand:- start:232 stop:1146 length:915 start_codon:yes stop_codon:yes gene_type:complete